jgi:multiple sugar transport system permease protein
MRWAFLFLAPALVLLAITVFYPMARALQYSLYKWPLGTEKTFVWLENYRRLIFEDGNFHHALQVTIFFTVLSVLPAIVIALFIAILLNGAIKFRGLFRTIYFVPVVTSLVAVAFVWRALLEPSFGLVNTVLGWFQISGPGWLASPDWALPGIALMTIWRDVGFYMVIFLAGLQAIPRDVTDAARLDGSGAWSRFWYVTLPLLNSSIVLATVIGVINGLQLFTQTYVMTGSPQRLPGGPLSSTRSVVLYIVEQTFRPLEMGYGSAAAFLLFAMIMVVTFVQFRLIQRKFEY